jgi:cation diffusion facilitator family transporter
MSGEHPGHGHSPALSHGHGHGHPASRWARARSSVRHALAPHGHGTGEIVDSTLEASRRGMRALWVSFAGLLLTTAVQAVVVGFTASVALLGDTVHNFADALTAVPLAIAFLLGRRAATRRFTHGLGRAEDLAGLVILMVMTASAAFAAWQAIDRFLHPRGLAHIGWVAAAGVVGFAGNEIVARYRITVGRQIGSAALVADGLHARTDGFTSLAVLLSAGGALADWWWADPVVGLLITVAILSVLWGAAKQVFARLLDAVDPRLVGEAERTLTGTPGVGGVDALRMRWIGHSLVAEAEVEVHHDLTLLEAHRIAHDAEHRLIHALPRLSQAMIHTHPAWPHADEQHDLLRHHRGG